MSHSRLRARVGIGIIAVFSAFVLVQTAPAQKGAPVPIAKKGDKDDGKKEKERNNFTDAFQLEIDRDASNKIEAVRQYLQKTDIPYPTIIEVLQNLLERKKDTFVEIEYNDPVKGKVKSKVSVKTEVNRIIGSFKPEGRQFYQLAYGQVAEKALKESLENNDKAKLAEIAERYLHTKAGAEATVRLGTWHLDRGRYIMAALTFEKLRYRNSEDPIPPHVLYQAALAYKRLGDKEADVYYKRFKEAMAGKTELPMGNKKLTLEQLQAEYDRVVAGARSIDQADWFISPGGSLTRNARGIGGRPFLEPRFTFSMTPIMDETEEKTHKAGMDWIKQNLDVAIKAFEQRPHLPIPAFFPIASNGKVMFRTYDGVYCVATKDDNSQNPPIKAGEMLWRYVCDDVRSPTSLYSMVKDVSPRSTFETNWWRQWYFNQGPYGIFFENGLLGALSHDGTNAYFVDDLAVPPHPQQIQQFGMNGQQMMFTPFQEGVYHSKLIAVNMETGKLIWKAGGRSSGAPAGGPVAQETAATLLSDCHFLGTPLPLAGKLYVLIEKQPPGPPDQGLYLVCLDPTKITNAPRGEGAPDTPTAYPELLWYQPLGTPNTAAPMDTWRRVQGVHLAYGDGILVCPTNAGAILGIDLLSHSLVWAHSYREAKENPNEPVQPQPGFRRGGFPGAMNPAWQPPVLDRWRTGMPVIVNGKVVFTAYDASSVQCLDLRTGELLWKSPRAAEDLYLGGVFEDRVMVVGKTSIRFLNLNSQPTDGQKTAERIGKDIPIGIPSGVGTASGNTYYLPVRSSADSKDPEVWSIDVMKGEILAKTKSRKKHAAGNLVFFEGDVYSQNPTHLVAFPQLQVKIDEMNRLLKANPNDPVGLIEMGELQLDDGKLMQCIESLKKAMTFNPPEAARIKGRDKLYEAVTELLQRDFDKGQEFLDEYKDLCTVAIGMNDDALKRQLAAEEELRRKSNAFLLVAKGREKQGRLVEAFDNYMAFGTLTGNKELVSVIDEPTTFARPDVWARGRIDNMIRKATPDQRKPLEEKIGAEWLKVKGANDLEALRAFVRVFGGMFSSGSEARLLLAEKLIATNTEEEMREAQNTLLSLRNGDEKAVAGRAVETLARLFIRKGLMEDAVALYGDLGNRYADVQIRDGKTGAEIYNDLITDKRFLPFLEPARQAWPSRIKATEISGNTSPIQPQPSFTIEPDGELLPFFKRHRLVMETNYQGTGQWGLRVLDRITGEERFRSPPVQPSNYIYNYPQMSFRFAQARGHLLILNINNKVYAFDLADRKQLWVYDLFGKTPMINPNPTQQIPEPDGGLRLVYADGWSQKLGQVGVIESNYVCLTTRDGLVALDPARGTTLWTKSNVSARVQLVGDENNVYIFEQNTDGSPAPTRVVRAQDGVQVEGVPDSSALFAKSNRLRIFGRNVLVFDDQGMTKSFRLYDLLTGKDLWKRDLDAKSLPLRSDDASMIGYVTSTGEVAAFDVRTGKEVFKSKLDSKWVSKHLEKVNEALLMQDAERFYVALNRPQEGNINVNPIVSQGMRTQRVNGHLYCFDKASGRRLWFTDEQLENQSILLEQFNDLPVLIAAMQYTRVNNGVFEGNGVRVVGIEKSTGKAKYRKEVSPNGQFQALVTDPKAGTIELWRYDLRIKFSPEDGKPTGALPNQTPLASAPTRPVIPVPQVAPLILKR